MIHTFRYSVPQTLFGPALFAHIDPAHSTLIITANRRHADWVRQQLRQQPRSNVQVRTLQAFMLTQLRQQRKFRVASASTRALLVHQAWQQVNGPLFRQHGHHRGALSELSTALGWISLQREQWRRPDPHCDWSGELGQTYLRYCDLLDQSRLIGYEDVACNLLESGCAVAPGTHVLACELQHAHPAQLRVLTTVAQQVTQFTAAAWLEATHHAPELQHVLDWMHTLAEPQPWPTQVASPTVPLITLQPDALTTPTQVSMFCSARYDQSWRAGVDTSLDECVAVSNYALAQLARQHTIDIISCDERQMTLLRQTLHTAGVALPPLAPPRHLNPLIRLLQGCVRWHVTDASEHATLVASVLQLPSIGATPAEAQRIASDPQHPRYRDIARWAAFLSPENAIDTALQHILHESGSMQWCWHSAQQRVDVSDYWLRDCRRWLLQIREMTQLAPFTQMPWPAQLQHILSIDTVPTHAEYLEQSTLPLHIHDRRGHQAAADVVIVMGLSESAGPLLAQDWQIVAEEELLRLCRGCGVAPRRSDPAAWRERELRRMAQSIGSHARHVVLSFAYTDIQGRAQLPSPFLEMMMGNMVQSNRHGDLIVTSSRITPILAPTPPRVTPTPVPPTPVIPLSAQRTFSATQIQRFLTCPKQFFYERMLALHEREDAETDTRRLDAGSIIHEVCCVSLGNGATKDVNLRHEHMNDYVNRLQQLPERSMAALQAAWHGEHITLPGGGEYHPTQRWSEQFDAGLKRMSSLHTLKRLLERWAHHEQRRWEARPYRRPVLLEQRLFFRTRHHQVVARIDRIDMGANMECEIIDYKTGSDKSYSELCKEFTVTEALQAKNFQIPLYVYGTRTPEWQLTQPAQAMTLMYIKEPKGGNKEASESSTNLEERTFHVHVGDQPSSLLTGSYRKHIGYTINEADLTQHIIPHADEVMTRMLSTPYPTKSGRHCAYCAFTTICDDASSEE